MLKKILLSLLIVTTIGCSLAFAWDNNNFLDQSFWANNPTSGDIVAALYGTGPSDRTAYTQYRSGWNRSTSCNVTGMQIMYLNPGQGSIPLQLSGNVVYVLSPGNYIQTGGIVMSPCSALVGGQGVVTLYSTGQLLGNTGMINIFGGKHFVIDNLKIDGSGDGLGGSHVPGNYFGILTTFVSNFTMNNLHLYGHYQGAGQYGGYATYIQGSSTGGMYGYNIVANNIYGYNNVERGFYYIQVVKGMITNSKFYNNGRGLAFHASYDLYMDMIDVYNNVFDGVFLDTYVNNCFFNNMQIYNNGQNGVNLRYAHHYNTFNNVQSYNNALYGISMAASNNNVFNNVMLYNNNAGIVSTATAKGNILRKVSTYNNVYGVLTDYNASGFIYYDQVNSFANTFDFSGVDLIQGTSTYLVSFNWNTGNIVTGIAMSWDYVVNPKNTFTYLLSWSGLYNQLIGRKTFTSVSGIVYSYGSGILLQQQPVIWSGTSALIATGTYTSGWYIGAKIGPLTGSIHGLTGTMYYLSNEGVSVQSATATGYSLYGNLSSYYSTSIGNAMSIRFSAGSGTKRVIAQLYGPFATHFETAVILSGPCMEQIWMPGLSRDFCVVQVPNLGNSFVAGNILHFSLEQKNLGGNLLNNQSYTFMGFVFTKDTLGGGVSETREVKMKMFMPGTVR